MKAIIFNEELGRKITLELRRDGDAYRWYESESGADTEVSGASEEAALEAASAAWRTWEFQLVKGAK